MDQIIEELNESDEKYLSERRDWLINHFETPEAYSMVSAKLKLIDSILTNDWVSKDETWKLQALGVALGDALVQEADELKWVVVEDEYGRDLALRWQNASVLVFPLTAISNRIEDEEEVDIHDLFSGFRKTILQIVKDNVPKTH